MNFAAHAAKLGSQSYLVSAVGWDERGERALRMISSLGLSTDYIQKISGQPTGYVSVELRPDGQPSFTIHRPAAYDYAELFSALPEPAYLTYGNVDVPAMWQRFTKPGHHVLDGGTAELDGWTFGFVGGGLKSVYRTPNEISDEEFRAKIEAVGEVDVLCTHIPPAVPELLYDTVARRLEKGSTALLDAIKATKPRYSIFGHVHQPLARRTRIGVTECLNVGHFRATGAPFVLQW